MLDPESAIDQINAAFGKPKGYRTLHAKGRFYTGTFTATPEAGELGSALHLQGPPVPVVVRWSNGGGNPHHPDGATDVRGMAVSFRLPDGTATDLLGQTAPRFPVRTPEAFVELVKAANKPYLLPVFLARHPSAVPAMIANARAKSIAAPASYADATFYPVHAYKWLAADGTASWVRYTFVPQAGESPGVFKGADRLQDEMAARLQRGPVRHTMRVQVAGPADDPHDPMSVWSSSARVFDAGTIEVTALDPDREKDGAIFVFDPARIVTGIELSDDPILRYRPGAYTASVNRRV
jgi:catalase